MRGLTIIAQSRSALALAIETAAAHGAIGGATRLFITGEAITAFDIAALDDLFALSVCVILCQSRLAANDPPATALDPRFEGGGLVSLLQTLGEDRLIAF